MPVSPANDALEPIKTNEFLPPVSRWVTAGSWFIVLALGGAIAASFLVKYRTTVKASATIRPTGQPRLVQAAVTGQVVEIKARSNTTVEKGAAIALLDTSSLEARAIQLLANLDQGQSKLQQINAQMATVDQQIAAEAAQAQRSVAASAADYSQIQRAQRTQTITAQAAVQEAQAQADLAAREVESFSQLVESGAVSRLQLSEKQAALASAQARMVGLQAALDPSAGEVEAARERIAQAQAGGVATLARLQQSKQQLVQQGLEIQEQLQNTEQEIAQVNLGLQNSVVRSPITGTLHELNLRNTGQMVTPGETLAKVIPNRQINNQPNANPQNSNQPNNRTPIEIKALVPAQQINKVDVGYPAQMRVSACPYSEFGTLKGEVTAISPDTITFTSPSEENSPTSAQAGAFYSVTLSANTPTLRSTTSGQICELQPGTEGRVTIVSNEETVITFLRRKAGLLTDF